MVFFKSRKIKKLLEEYSSPQVNQANNTIVKEKPERAAFESAFLIDNPTNVLFNKNTLEVTMAHRFGEFGNTNDLVGFWGASNIFNHLKETLNIVWGVKPKPGVEGTLAFIRGRLLAFALIFGAGFLLAAYFLVNTLVAAAIPEPGYGPAASGRSSTFWLSTSII